MKLNIQDDTKDFLNHIPIRQMIKLNNYKKKTYFSANAEAVLKCNNEFMVYAC